MRILILGGDGMLGHQALKDLRWRHEVRVTLRQDLAAYQHYRLFTTANAYGGIDVRHTDSLVGVLADFQPEAILNATGIVKQRPEASQSILSLEINSLFPHRLAVLAAAIKARLVHISTDCVFSGKKGSYKESDVSDAEDLYGRSKYLGEVHEKNTITLRTSIIGRELSRKHGLLEWFLAQRGTVRGFRKAIYSGFTTHEIIRVIEKLLVQFPHCSGLYHVSSDPVSKYDLLMLVKAVMKVAVEIVPDDSFQCDRSLDSSQFRREFHYSPPSWEVMIQELQKSTEEQVQ